MVQHTFNFGTSNICISCIAIWTVAHWYMIDYRTKCFLSTHICTRINTFIIDTGFITRTFGIQNTFWMATKVWISNVIRYTGAYTVIAFRICSAWIWSTFILNFWFFVV